MILCLTKKLFLALLILLTTASCALSSGLAPWPGKVVGVSDGDTVTVLKDGEGVRIRVAEVDTPEKRQPYGQKAKQFTSDLCFGKIVTVQPNTVDRYGRVVGHVILPDGRSLTAALIEAGMGWQYRKYSKDPKLAELEAAARAAKRGLWQGPNPVPPWEWRRHRRKGNRQPNSLGAAAASAYHGNTNSRVFHAPGCKWYDCKNCTAAFKTKHEAIAAGYRPCGLCKP